MEKVRIELNPANGRFMIYSPFWANDKMRGIPNRRWDGRRKAWVAPAVRANSEYLLSSFKRESFDPAAWEAANSAVERKRPTISRFPADYPHRLPPRVHQSMALDKMHGARAGALFMCQRSGKSKIVIDLMCAAHAEERVDRVLVVCPAAVRDNWAIQLRTHATREFSARVHGSDRARSLAWCTEPEDFKWLIITIEGLSNGRSEEIAAKFLGVSTRAAMVIDESHRIKNHKAKATEKCLELRNLAEYRFIMTGTSIAKGPIDLFAQYEFLDPDIIGVGDWYSFRNRYAVMGGFDNKEIIGYQHMDELIELIAPFTVQVQKQDITDSIKEARLVVTADMNPEQRKIYEKLRKTRMIAGDGGRMLVQNALEKALRMQEICGGWYSTLNPAFEPGNGELKFLEHRIGGINPKIVALLGAVKEYTGSTLVWCARTHEVHDVITALREEYGEDQVVGLYGEITRDQRMVNIYDLFQTGRARFLVGNAATGGVGLDMFRADVVIYYSNTHRFIDRKQSEERAWIPGKESEITYIDIVCSNSVDMLFLDAFEAKQDIADYVSQHVSEARNRLGL